MKDPNQPPEGMNLAEALALSGAGDLVKAYLTDTGQTEDAEVLASALRKFKDAVKFAVRDALPPDAQTMAAFAEALSDRKGREDAHLN